MVHFVRVIFLRPCFCIYFTTAKIIDQKYFLFRAFLPFLDDCLPVDRFTFLKESVIWDDMMIRGCILQFTKYSWHYRGIPQCVVYGLHLNYEFKIHRKRKDDTTQCVRMRLSHLQPFSQSSLPSHIHVLRPGSYFTFISRYIFFFFFFFFLLRVLATISKSMSILWNLHFCVE